MEKRLKLPSEVTGKGKPLVLVPGGLTGWKSWDSFVNYFTSNDRMVVRVQVLSVQWGIDNKPLPADYSVKTESYALKATLDSIGLKSAVDILAWSFGGLITLDFALDNPERIRSLTLIEPPAIWVLHTNEGIDQQTQKTMRLFQSFHGDITDEMLSKFLVNVGFAREGESPRDQPQWQQWLPYKLSLRNSPAVVHHNDILKRLRDIKSPVLLVKGTGSANFLHKIIDILSKNLPDSRVTEMPGGHAPHIVSRERFLREWERFQKDLH